MRMRKKTVSRLQDLALLLLTVSALFLLTRLPFFSDSLGDRVQAFLSAAPSDSSSSQAVDLSSTIPSLHLVSTGDIEYGRHSQLYMAADAPALLDVLPLFREALGSAVLAGATGNRTMQTALDSPGLFLDLTTQLPVQVVAAWLGEETALDRDVRAMALTTEAGDKAVLYLYSDDGAILRYDTALSVSAVREAAQAFSPNGGSFAFETNYSPLRPYTVLAARTSQVMDIHVGIPDGYSAYNLLTALDFNAHTNFRYFESSGTEVVEESPRTLRLAPDGTVIYSGVRYAGSPLYQVPCAGDAPTATEALYAATRLASVLSGGTDASPMYLQSLAPTDTGWTVTFSYQWEGLPVRLSDDSQALSVSITGRSITSFTYCCRSFTPVETPSVLLPPAMAVAIASLHPGSGLSICYVDSGSDLLTAQWLAG